MERVRNERIRQMMEVVNTVVEMIEQKRLMWYGHLKRTKEDRISKTVADGSQGEEEGGEAQNKMDWLYTEGYGQVWSSFRRC